MTIQYPPIQKACTRRLDPIECDGLPTWWLKTSEDHWLWPPRGWCSVSFESSSKSFLSSTRVWLRTRATVLHQLQRVTLAFNRLRWDTVENTDNHLILFFYSFDLDITEGSYWSKRLGPEMWCLVPGSSSSGMESWKLHVSSERCVYTVHMYWVKYHSTSLNLALSSLTFHFHF